MSRKRKHPVESLRIQLAVSEVSWPALFVVLKEAGPYRQSKRILQLALAGLAVEQGSNGGTAATTPSHPPPQRVAPTKKGAKVEQVSPPVERVKPHYSPVSEQASEGIGAMLDSLDS